HSWVTWASGSSCCSTCDVTTAVCPSRLLSYTVRSTGSPPSACQVSSCPSLRPRRTAKFSGTTMLCSDISVSTSGERTTSERSPCSAAATCNGGPSGASVWPVTCVVASRAYSCTPSVLVTASIWGCCRGPGAETDRSTGKLVSSSLPKARPAVTAPVLIIVTSVT